MSNTIIAERNQKLIDHLEHEHHRSPFANYIKEVIYGGVDGIVTTFAVVAGFSGAAISHDATTQLSFLIVLLFGLANLFADATSMGLGNFLSVRSEKDLYNAARKKEMVEVKNNPEAEYEETVTIMMKKGFTDADARKLADIYRSNETYWVDFMMTYELEMSDPRGDIPALTGLATFTSFMVFGVIPLLPFIFISNATPGALFQYSVMGTFIALTLLGALKWKVIGGNLAKALFEVIVVGGVAALVAFFVGTFFAI